MTTGHKGSGATPVLIVPGWTNSGPDHWQSRWQRENPGWRRIEQADWDDPDPADWIATLDTAVRDADAPPLLVGHSLGAIAIAHWALDTSEPRVAAAFLVAPADVERADAPPAVRRFAPVRLGRLPFPSIVVASRTDAYLSWTRAVEFADAWGSRLHDAGDAGHINSDAGFGNWPDGVRLLGELMDAVP